MDPRLIYINGDSSAEFQSGYIRSFDPEVRLTPIIPSDFSEPLETDISDADKSFDDTPSFFSSKIKRPILLRDWNANNTCFKVLGSKSTNNIEKHIEFDQTKKSFINCEHVFKNLQMQTEFSIDVFTEYFPCTFCNNQTISISDCFKNLQSPVLCQLEKKNELNTGSPSLSSDDIVNHRVMFYSKITGPLYGKSLHHISKKQLNLYDLAKMIYYEECTKDKSIIYQNQTAKNSPVLINTPLEFSFSIDENSKGLATKSNYYTNINNDINGKSAEKVEKHDKNLNSDSTKFMIKNKDKSRIFWVSISDPTLNEVEIISKAFNLHSLTTEDLINIDETSDKLRVYSDYAQVDYSAIEGGFFEYDVETEGKNYSLIESVPFIMILKAKCFITVHTKKSISYVKQTVNKLVAMESDGFQEFVVPEHICFLLIDDITEDMGPITRMIEVEVDSVDEMTLYFTRKEFHDMLRRLGLARRRILSLFKILQKKPAVIKSMINEIKIRMQCTKLQTEMRSQIEINKETIMAYTDLADRLVYLMSTCSQAEIMLARSHLNHMGKIQLELASTNEVISKLANDLTIIGVTVMPFMIVGSLFGMNVKVPGQEIENLSWFFSIFAGCTILVIIVGYMYRKGIKEIE
ncbi:hypothetical protein BB558_001295 [Smittium angustum]|uniref:Uncharacterized protein n=1 Tax=Smittium angustum TaxID=133377 RepID=A0A2U1JC73_SMIAN|nr:hypothetical protein BB558_001295 [Smittium angustum]